MKREIGLEDISSPRSEAPNVQGRLLFDTGTWPIDREARHCSPLKTDWTTTPACAYPYTITVAEMAEVEVSSGDSIGVDGGGR